MIQMENSHIHASPHSCDSMGLFASVVRSLCMFYCTIGARAHKPPKSLDSIAGRNLAVESKCGMGRTPSNY